MGVDDIDVAIAPAKEAGAPIPLDVTQLMPGIRIAMGVALIGQNDDRPAAARKLVPIALEAGAQLSLDSVVSSARLSGCAGWMVDTACL